MVLRCTEICGDLYLFLFLSARGVSYLFDIQVKTFNPVYEGKDLIGQARTGTGKTFSFAVPLVEKLQSGPEDRRRGRPPKVTLTFSHQCCALWVSAVNQSFKCHEIYSRQQCTCDSAPMKWFSWTCPELWWINVMFPLRCWFSHRLVSSPFKWPKTSRTSPGNCLLRVSTEEAHTTHKVGF